MRVETNLALHDLSANTRRVRGSTVCCCDSTSRVPFRCRRAISHIPPGTNLCRDSVPDENDPELDICADDAGECELSRHMHMLAHAMFRESLGRREWLIGGGMACD